MAGRITGQTPSISTGTVNVGLRDLVFVLYRRRWAALFVALPIILVGGYSLTQEVGSYSAFSKVVVGLANVDLPRWNTSNRSIDYDRELSTLFNIAMSVPVAENAAKALRDSIPLIKQLGPEFADIEAQGELFNYLATNLDVSVVGESSILEFVFTSAYPRLSLMAVGALRDAFIDYQVHGRKNFHAVAYYDDQIETVRASIDSILAVRSEVLASNGYSSLEDNMKFDAGQLASLEGDYYSSSVARRSLAAEYERLLEALTGDPRSFPMGPDESRSFPLVAQKNLVGEHEDKLNSLLAIHTEESLPVRRQKDVLLRALASLKHEQESYVEGFRISLAAARDKETSLRELVEQQKVKNSLAPAIDHRVTLIDIELESLRGLMKDLQGKRGEVRLDQMADERVSSIVVLNEPELQLTFGGGKKFIYFILLVVVGLVLGFVTAFLLDGMDHRIYSPVDVEEKLNLPVLASISRSD